MLVFEPVSSSAVERRPIDVGDVVDRRPVPSAVAGAPIWVPTMAPFGDQPPGN